MDPLAGGIALGGANLGADAIELIADSPCVTINVAAIAANNAAMMTVRPSVVPELSCNHQTNPTKPMPNNTIQAMILKMMIIALIVLYYHLFIFTGNPNHNRDDYRLGKFGKMEAARRTPIKIPISKDRVANITPTTTVMAPSTTAAVIGMLV
jgi:hypothetical protein